MRLKTLSTSVLLFFVLLLGHSCSQDTANDSNNEDKDTQNSTDSSSDTTTDSISDTISAESLSNEALALLNTDVNSFVCKSLTDQLLKAIDDYQTPGQTDESKCETLANISDIQFAITQNDNPSEEDECDLPETPDLQQAADEFSDTDEYIDCTPDDEDTTNSSYSNALEVLDDVCDSLTERLANLVDIYTETSDEDTKCQALTRIQSIGFWMEAADNPSVTTECDYEGNDDLAAIKTKMDAEGYVDCTPDTSEG